jgi:hypothetical protein
MVREVACKAEIPPDKSMSMHRVSGAVDMRSVPPAQSSLWVCVMRPPSVVVVAMVAAVGWQWVGNAGSNDGSLADAWGQANACNPVQACRSGSVGKGQQCSGTGDTKFG